MTHCNFPSISMDTASHLPCPITKTSNSLAVTSDGPWQENDCGRHPSVNLWPLVNPHAAKWVSIPACMHISLTQIKNKINTYMCQVYLCMSVSSLFPKTSTFFPNLPCNFSETSNKSIHTHLATSLLQQLSLFWFLPHLQGPIQMPAPLYTVQLTLDNLLKFTKLLGLKIPLQNKMTQLKFWIYHLPFYEHEHEI